MHLSYADMPFVLYSNLWSKISFNKNSKYTERAHGDGIKVSTESPEAFEEVFWKTFEHENEEELKKILEFILEILFINIKKRDTLVKTIKI